MEGQTDVMNCVTEFYNNLYTSEPASDIDKCLEVVPNCISTEMNSGLTAPVSNAEIKDTVFAIGAQKAPGHDGLNDLFYQTNWETIKEDVVMVVKSFFDSHSLGSDTNLTSVCLIPKVPQPESISDLRPISCYSYIYKVIAKIFVAHLKRILSNIITPQQSAFVGGRMIQDNLIIAHEAFLFLKGKQGKCGREWLLNLT